MSKRMFNTTIVESDVFLDMPLTAQSLYFHLGMNADNDGFVNPKRIMRMIGAGNDDLQILLSKRFLLYFDSGVVAVKHWWIHNTKRLDRHVPTTYQNELSGIYIKHNKAYTKDTTQLAILTEVDAPPEPSWQPTGNQMSPEANSSHVHSNSIQVNTNQPEQVFKKNKDPEFLKQYAKASQADRDQQARAITASKREGESGYELARAAAERIKKRSMA